jgi:hypothetical protein
MANPAPIKEVHSSGPVVEVKLRLVRLKLCECPIDDVGG